MPDPCARETFEAARLDWSCREQTDHVEWLQLFRDLLAIRRRQIRPLLRLIQPGQAQNCAPGALRAAWPLSDGRTLTVMCNLSAAEVAMPVAETGTLIYMTPSDAVIGTLPPWTTQWRVGRTDDG